MKRKILTIIGCVLGVVVLAAAGGYIYLNHAVGQIKVKPIDSSVADASQTDSGQTLVSSDNVTNVLLIGSDTREVSEAGRSDSMILLSLNDKTKTITMTSFMRDMYVSIPDHGKNKINAAYSYGGASLLIRTIQNNFDIKIDRYASVDFFSFIKIIDRLGGVRITVTAAELPVLNDYIKEINTLEHLSSTDGLLRQSGSNLLLTGKQALGYSRIRYVGNADFQRTERQRTVLNQVFTGIKNQNVFNQMSLLNELLPDVTTSFSKAELVSYVTRSLQYKSYTVVQDRVPIDGSYQDARVNGQDVLQVDLAKNQAELKSKLYGK